MLLELAIGDAYGAGFEYADMKFVRGNNDLGKSVSANCVEGGESLSLARDVVRRESPAHQVNSASTSIGFQFGL
jgi:hypothetical protein